MRYAILSEPGKIAVEQKPVPKIEPTKVLVKVKVCGLCGTDLLLYRDKFPVHYPYSPGHEYSGIAVKAGESVRHIKPGDRVTVNPNHSCGSCWFCHNNQPHLCDNLKVKVKSNGGFADYTLVPGKIVHVFPKTLSFENATFVEPLSCCLHAFDKAGRVQGDTIVVLGAGTMGLLMVRLFAMSGAAKIIVSEPSGLKRKLARKFGAQAAVDPGKESLEEVVRKANHRGADLVVDCAATNDTLKDSFQLVRKGGRIIWLGVPDQNRELTFMPFPLVQKDLTLFGSILNPNTFSRAIEILSSGAIDPSPVISHTFKLKDIAAAFSLLSSGKAVKILVKP